MFIATYTEQSSLSDKLFESTFEDAGVQAELSHLLCIKVNLTQDGGGQVMDKNAERIADRIPDLPFPTILYLGADLSPEDFISGFITGPALQVELQRMRAGTNTLSDLRIKAKEAPKDIEILWALASKCKDFGYSNEHQKLMRTIYKLDPDITSRPLRLERLTALQGRLLGEYTETGKYDHFSITRFLKHETNPTVAFTGWSQLGDMVRTIRPKITDKKEQKVLGPLSRKCCVEAWNVVAPADKTDFAVLILRNLFQDRKELNGKDRKFASAVVSALNAAIEGRDDTPVAQAAFYDAQACAAFIAKDKESARSLISEAIRLDPANPLYAKRKQELASPTKK